MPKSSDRLTGSRALVVVLATILAASSGPAMADPPAADSAAGRTVRLARWQAYYEGLATAREDDAFPNLPDVPSDGPAPPPSLRGKYDRSSVAVGMDSLATDRFKAVQAAAGQAARQTLSRWKLVVTRCTASGPALLTSIDAGARRICVSPVLLTSLFLESVGTEYLRLNTRLRRLGVDPATFTGEYVGSLHGQGVTPADWTSLLDRFSEPAWSRFRRSVDVVVARAAFCGALASPKPTCGREAVAAVRRIDPGVDASSLVAALASATSNYDIGSWGYESAGDGANALDQIRSDVAG